MAGRGRLYEVDVSRIDRMIEQRMRAREATQSTPTLGGRPPFGSLQQVPTQSPGGSLAHASLSDMPSATNSDHDGRYYTEAEVDALLATKVEGSGTYRHPARWDSTGNGLEDVPNWTYADTTGASVYSGAVSTALTVSNTSTGAGVRAILGFANAAGGLEGIGVYGDSNTPSGKGVFGRASAATSANYGVYGSTSSSDPNAFSIYANESLYAPSVTGSTASGGDLTLHSTTHASKGSIILGNADGVVFDEATNKIQYGPEPTNSAGSIFTFGHQVAGTTTVHCISDSNLVTIDGATADYGSYDGRVHFDGSGHIEHSNSFQAAPTLLSTFSGDFDQLAGFGYSPTILGGTVTQLFGMYLSNPITAGGTGAIGDNYALYIVDQGSVPSGDNYAIYSAATQPNYFGGAVGIGSGATVRTANISGATYGAPLHVRTSAATDLLGLANFHKSNTAAFTAYLSLMRARDSGGSADVVQNNDYLGEIIFGGYDGTDYEIGAAIIARVDGTPGSGDMPTRLLFLTTPDASATPAERLRIASTGAWGLGGANYGTSGTQAIVSNGSAASPTWQTIYVPGGTDVPVTDGGTGSSTAAGARNQLGIVYTLHAQCLAYDPADAANNYFGGVPVAPGAATQRRLYIPRAGTIVGAEIYSIAGGAPGSNENWSLYIRLNNTTDTLIATVGSALANRQFSNLGLSIAVVAGDYIEIKTANPTWAINPTQVAFGGSIIIQ